ncbi:putative transcription factor GRAS family [Helianthus annuus]|uniref:scarecrow-like protein 9 isoform X2 n=1 Tax=Helianthus annuus TaxID=4232 RepID=UPI00165315A8|nr:scarecrow-like protein 9 isoform X2 [Helianthus annuus]KAJ0610832.1 putative transcription factor GRAS family [Helianthus annuus]KAJ0621659.1 putative transcription factor GRAS family [Helianthus annuus]KAJ0626082.1 putative transcription factor GRAS family [Helianthus annuus]KAJ0782420.1 putative transcription factor GRAS family [Helianthus annuus]KAJ0947017.1 putative transcription factor GRAS family [Helianthus annuus]
MFQHTFLSIVESTFTLSNQSVTKTFNFFHSNTSPDYTVASVIIPFPNHHSQPQIQQHIHPQMDPRFGTSINRNGGTQLNNQSIHMLPDQKPIHNHSFPVNMYQNSHNFRGLQFDPPTTSSSPIVSSSTENELHEDCDLSDAILGYISQVLMEEDMEDKSCVLYESLDLQAAEKSFYDVLGQKYPPSPSYDEGSRVRKGTYEGDEDDQRSVKQAAIFQDATVRSNEIDLILLCSMGQGEVALRLLRNKLRTETGKDMHKDNLPKSLTKGRGKTRGKKPKSKKEVIDLRTLLVTCAQAVATDDRRNASELLKQIRQHASPFGDGNQRLAHWFANGLEARLAGTGSQIHRGLVSKKVSAADYIRAYYLYIGCSPFRKISNFASNRTIMDMAQHATRIHIIDFGILYGFQWPTFIQRISQREGGPPRIRLTGIEFPQPGFRPAETIEETGVRLKEYAKKFNVQFEYKSIAKRWENVSIEDLKIDENEFLVVNCMYRSKNVLDETVGVDSARNVVLDLIRKTSPNIFIHGILNGSYNAPFFLTRFKEALFHFSALFDMLETNVPRERSERKLLEGEVFGREALNVIACEGWERIERPETYKQWHVRNLRAGFVSVPFSREIIKLAKEKVGLYHKDFMIDVDNDWLLQGWKGRIIYAMSCWKAA